MKTPQYMYSLIKKHGQLLCYSFEILQLTMFNILEQKQESLEFTSLKHLFLLQRIWN